MSDQPEVQAAAAVLMIRPAVFGSNPETLQSNSLQSPPSGGDLDIAHQARTEFDALVEILRSTGVEVRVFEGRAERDAPDEIFPNNWVSTHADGTVVLYPMMTKNRRVERRPELFETVDSHSNYRATQVVDLTSHELQQHYLEGTGSLVLDRINHVAYANLSPRTHLDALGDFSQRLDYDIVTFEATDERGRPIYHTNVLMSVGTGFAVICSGTIKEKAKRAAVLETLESSGREIVELRSEQLSGFAGNLLELSTPEGPLIALSSSAWKSLDEAQQEKLKSHGKIVTAPIPTVERFGGGSVRCILAEIHLPR